MTYRKETNIPDCDGPADPWWRKALARHPVLRVVVTVSVGASVLGALAAVVWGAIQALIAVGALVIWCFGGDPGATPNPRALYFLAGVITLVGVAAAVAVSYLLGRDIIQGISTTPTRARPQLRGVRSFRRRG